MTGRGARHALDVPRPATADTVYPYGLAALVTDLLAGRTPQRPVRLPWHQ